MPLIPGMLRSGWCIRAVAVADDEKKGHEIGWWVVDGGCILEGGEAQGESDGGEKLDRVAVSVIGSSSLLFLFWFAVFYSDHITL